MTNWASWQPWLIGGLACLVVVWFVVRALFGDTARNGPRCLRCGQPFRPEQDPICTECGWVARSPRDPLRTRRHWGKATLGLGVLLTAAVVVRVAAQGGDPLVIVPDRLLAAMLRFDPANDPGATGPIALELRRRLIERPADDPLVDVLCDIVIRGDASAPPGSDRWFSRYGPIAEDLRDGFVAADSEAGRRLARIPPAIDIEVPPMWPQDEPMPATLSVQDCWPLGTEAIIDLAWSDSREEPVALETIGYRNLSSTRRRHQFLLPPALEWPAVPTLEVAVSTRNMSTNTVTRIAAGIGVELEEDRSAVPSEMNPPIRLQESVATPGPPPEVPLTPWSGDEFVDNAVAEVFSEGLRRWPGTIRPFAIRFNPRRLRTARLDGVLFGLEVEIVERTSSGGELVHRRTRMWMPGGVTGDARGNPIGGWTISEEDTAGLAGAFDADNTSKWLMRIRGREDLARRSLARMSEADVALHDRWWSGTVERDLPTSTERNRPFIRMWFHPEGVRSPAPEDTRRRDSG